jgi:hypothetical protein
LYVRFDQRTKSSLALLGERERRKLGGLHDNVGHGAHLRRCAPIVPLKLSATIARAVTR